MVEAVKLPVDSTVDATQMAQTMFGSGVQLVSAQYSGNAISKGIYTNGDAVSPGVVPSNSGVILSTGRASDFTADTGSGDANQRGDLTTETNGVDNNPYLNEIAGGETFDGAILEASFIPQGSTLTMQLVFSSEEYPEYAGTGFNDAVAIFVNGERAVLSIGNGDISITNITRGGTNADGNPITPSNENLYVDNAGSQYNTEMDGFTITLTLKAPVNPGQVNNIFIGIADAGDRQFDSNLLIAADSVQTAVIASDFNGEMNVGTSKTFDVLADAQAGAGATLTITQINGQDVVAGDSVVLVSGTVVTLNPDGTLTFDASDTPGTETISYTISDQTGTTDVGFVTVEVAPCFTRGTLIETPTGPVPIEQLRSGDLVETRDNGPQPILWLGHSAIDEKGLKHNPKLKPIRIKAGALGVALPLVDLVVSPQHRILIRSKIAQSMFGIGEVLVAAKQLLSIEGIDVVETASSVDYYHILLAQHDMIFSNGAWTESLFTGPQALKSLSEEGREEIMQIFPELRGEDGRPNPARLFPKGRLCRELADRHAESGLALAY
ncbi:Hint domain-containing protein [Falsirhodobacter halotolerans]|uniref:Hint domain-containing protein n=1 Tax=Falsirhodobacter halotolerans TaxID=1146892 RepID=UPI001FD1768C|nr:Hint domain-containing protein [Falsirhodobacter halotolerans]MCJ8139533.1 Hint domain-containing protein [Falsirhodobacter halotolerans]